MTNPKSVATIPIRQNGIMPEKKMQKTIKESQKMPVFALEIGQYASNMKKTLTKSFKDWQAEEVEKMFGIKKHRTLPPLDKIMKMILSKDHQKREILEAYRLELFDYIDSWNEDEYKFMFISPFFEQVNFLSEYYKAFTQRQMSVNYDNDTKTTTGNVEFMLAKGRQIPEAPHFFLHEYNRPPLSPQIGGIKGGDNDPLGQLLISMVASQKMNPEG